MKKEYINPTVDCLDLQGDRLMWEMGPSGGSEGDAHAPERTYRPAHFGL